VVGTTNKKNTPETKPKKSEQKKIKTGSGAAKKTRK
jgi:hypothetical protein